MTCGRLIEVELQCGHSTTLHRNGQITQEYLRSSSKDTDFSFRCRVHDELRAATARWVEIYPGSESS